MENNLTYTDENGNKLFGYSQTSLDNNTKWIKRLVILGYVGFVYLLFMTGYIIWNNVLNNVVARCGCGF